MESWFQYFLRFLRWKDTVNEPVIYTTTMESPGTILNQDLASNAQIQSEVLQLQKSMDCTALIVITAYKVADYVPNLEKAEHREFWQNQVIPALVKSLDQDVKARDVVLSSFMSIRNLGIVIQRGAELVKLSRGSPTSIAAAQRTINEAQQAVKKSIEEAESISSFAIEDFSAKTTKLLQIMGPEAANFSKQKAEIEDQIRQQYEKQQQLYTDIAHKKGEMERYSHLIQATEDRTKGSAAALEATKRRTEEMMALNAQLEATIQAVPPTLIGTKTTTSTRHNRLLWRKNTHTSICTKPVPNLNREVEKNYYESLVESRAARIRQNEQEAAAKEKVASDLEKCLSDYKAKYQSLLHELKQCEKSLGDKKAAIQREIDSLNAKLVNIDKEEGNATTALGLQGNTLIQCLTDIRVLAKAISNGATAYKPLVGVLKAVLSSVDAQIQMMNSKDPNEISLGGNELLRQVECIRYYHESASECLKPPSEYQAITGNVQMQALELSPKP